MSIDPQCHSTLPLRPSTPTHFSFTPLLLLNTVLCFLFKFIFKKKITQIHTLSCLLWFYCWLHIINVQMHILHYLLSLSPKANNFSKKKKSEAVFRTLTSVDMEKCLSLSCIWLFPTSWTVAHQAPLSIEFSRQEYWSGLPIPSPGESSQSRDQTQVSWIAGGFFTHQATRKTLWIWEGR